MALLFTKELRLYSKMKENLEKKTEKVRRDRREWLPYYGIGRILINTSKNSKNKERSFLYEPSTLQYLLICEHLVTTLPPILYGLQKLADLYKHFF